MIRFAMFLIPCIVWAGFSDVPDTQLYLYRAQKNVQSNRSPVIKPKAKKDSELKLLLEQDQRIEELLTRQERNVIVKRSVDKVVALTRLRGTILNSILAMNVKPSKFIVRLHGEEDLENAEIRCLGYSFEKRVPAHCDLLILEGKEYEVDIDIWDLDGAEGIIADYYYSGEEKTFLTSSFAAFLQGVLDVAKDRINTPFGQVERNNAKNKVLGGLVGVADNVREKVSESGEKNLTIAYVNSGKEILVFFNQSLSLGKEVEK